MSFTSTTHLALQKPSDGETAYGSELRALFDMVDAGFSPSDSWFVSPGYTDALVEAYATPADRRFFPTVQAAITAAEATTISDRHTIYIWPGSYSENLTITESFHFTSIGGGYSQFYSPVILTSPGSDTTITINPAAAQDIVVTFDSIRITNTVVTQGNTTVSWPLWVDVTDQGDPNYGNFQNQITFNNCFLRFDGSVGSDVYTYGIKAVGKSSINFVNSQMISSSIDMTNPFWIEGNIATSVSAQLRAKRSEFQWWENSTLNELFNLGNGSSGIVYDCGFTEPSFTKVRQFFGSGANDLDGLADSGQVSSYKNAFGVNSCIF